MSRPQAPRPLLLSGRQRSGERRQTSSDDWASASAPSAGRSRQHRAQHTGTAEARRWPCPCSSPPWTPHTVPHLRWVCTGSPLQEATHRGLREGLAPSRWDEHLWPGSQSRLEQRRRPRRLLTVCAPTHPAFLGGEFPRRRPSSRGSSRKTCRAGCRLSARHRDIQVALPTRRICQRRAPREVVADSPPPTGA